MKFRQYHRNFFKRLFQPTIFSVLAVVGIVLSLINLPVQANNQGVTITELVISPQLISSVIFNVSPGNIFVGETLTFTLGPALTSTNTILSNIPCEIWILSPTISNYAVLSGTTNNLGMCTYRTNLSLNQQNLILLTQPLTPNFPRAAGTQNVTPQNNLPGSPLLSQAVGGNTNLGSINGIVGGGTAFGLVVYQGNGIISNVVNYAVSGGISGIDSDYPTDNGNLGGGNGTGSGNTGGNNNNGSNNNSNSNPNSNIFNFLPRTGGFAASVGFIIGFIVLIIFVISRRKTLEEHENQKKYRIKKTLPKD